MTNEEWLAMPTDWVAAFEKSKRRDPSIFQVLVMTEVPLPLRKYTGAIVSDARMRHWLVEVTISRTRGGAFGGKTLTPIYGPWKGRRPDMIVMNEFETVMDDALAQIKKRRKAA